jgi:hypothetical protein
MERRQQTNDDVRAREVVQRSIRIPVRTTQDSDAIVRGLQEAKRAMQASPQQNRVIVGGLPR